MSGQVPQRSTKFPCSIKHKNQPAKIEYSCHCGGTKMYTNRAKKQIECVKCGVTQKINRCYIHMRMFEEPAETRYCEKCNKHLCDGCTPYYCGHLI